MSARSEFPWPVGDAQQAIKQHGVMCDLIDRLRAEQTEALDYTYTYTLGYSDGVRLRHP